MPLHSPFWRHAKENKWQIKLCIKLAIQIQTVIFSAVIGRSNRWHIKTLCNVIYSNTLHYNDDTKKATFVSMNISSCNVWDVVSAFKIKTKAVQLLPVLWSSSHPAPIRHHGTDLSSAWLIVFHYLVTTTNGSEQVLTCLLRKATAC